MLNAAMRAIIQIMLVLGMIDIYKNHQQERPFCHQERQGGGNFVL